jgi:hypothetical protein
MMITNVFNILLTCSVSFLSTNRVLFHLDALIEYSTPQNSDHWLSLPKHVTLSVDYESKKKKIYCSI